MGKQLMDQGCGERGIWRANGLTKQGSGAPHRRARAQAGAAVRVRVGRRSALVWVGAQERGLPLGRGQGRRSGAAFLRMSEIRKGPSCRDSLPERP